MCLAVPGKVETIEIQDEVFSTGTVNFGGIRKTVNLSYVPDVQIGNYVIVHVGVALSVLNEEEAQKTLEELDALGRLEELGPDQP